MKRANEYYKKNQEKCNLYNKEYYLKNKERLLERHMKLYRNKHPQIQRLTETQRRDNHKIAMNKYYHKRRVDKKHNVVKTIEEIEIKYNKDGMIILDIDI